MIEGFVQFSSASHCGPSMPMAASPALSRPKRPLRIQSQIMPPATTGTSEGRKKMVRKRERPRTGWLSSTAVNRETTSPSGSAHAAKKSVLRRDFQNTASSAMSR